MFCPLRRNRFFLILVCCCCLLVFLIYHEQSHFGSIANHPYFFYDLESEEPYDSNQSCRLPRIHPFDNSIWRYLSEGKPIKCRAQRLDSLTFVDSDGCLHFNQSVIESSGYKISSLHCVYQNILRSNQSDDQVEYGPEIALNSDGAYIENDFVRVSCKNFAGIQIYSTIHAHIRNLPPPTKIISSESDAQETSDVNKRPLNVVIFGLDSLSRLSFIRLLPKTYRFLTSVMGAFVFRGMTKVGDNTFPNLVAMLTGEEAYGKVLPPVPGNLSHYDDWPCIWKNYSEAGYRTLYAEDFPRFALFNYLSTGFKNPPTDHYFRPFWLAVESSMLILTSSHMCFGNIPKHQLQIKYLKDFLLKYRNIPHFAFSFHVEVSHEYLSQVTAVDDDLVSMLQFFVEEQLLNNTAFIFMSDHGHRFDAIRETLVGRIEERMPFFSIWLPEVLKEELPYLISNIKANTLRLTTPFDTYSTLLDLLLYSTKENHTLGQTRTHFGQSLFGVIPSTRTCISANIPDHYCTCENEVPLDIKDLRLKKSSLTVVSEINALLEKGLKNSNCARLSLNKVKSGHLLESTNRNIVSTTPSPSPANGGGKSNQKIRVVLETVPGYGRFEATVITNANNTHFRVLGDISRINKYGSQSSCIKHHLLRKYCFCL